ncbi:MAG TPA: hypothetical protein VLQ90_15615 [Pyrinomonadaceae bacterium]|nr:hypothetical protein [Pyrinomonadaceae bacterium]
MRAGVLVLTLVLALGVGMCGRANRGALGVAPSMLATSPPSSTNATKPDFDREIKPIFQSRCMPCHFQGGKVYDKLPFDKPETITKLGTKIFTRIKDEKEQRLIREFLAQP